MTLTEKQIYDLNNMNVAAQNVQLGKLLNDILSGSISGEINWINLDGLDEETKKKIIAILSNSGSPEEVVSLD